MHELLDRLCQATNAHDLDAIVGCFSPDYRNDTPAHPERSFTGTDQVRRNWSTILAMAPDITAEVLRSSADGDTVWSEWVHRGTRADGTAHEMAGVIIFGVDDGLATWARFYLEPVQHGVGGHDVAIARQLGGES